MTCLSHDSSANVIVSDGYKLVFNNATSYDDKIIYGVYYGSYYIRNVPPEYAFRLDNAYDYGTDPSNIDYSNNYVTSTQSISKGYNDSSYSYYYGDVQLSIKDDLSYINSDIKIQFIDGTYSSDLLVFTDTCASENSYYLECLDVSSSISVDSGKYILNSNSGYSEYVKYGLYVGTYQIHNIPTEHPIALLNADVSNIITYTGTTEYGTKQVNDISYTFYTGTLEITVKGDFNTGLSLYCYNHGFMGAENIFEFTDTCYDASSMSIFFTECMNTSQNIDVTNANMNLNGENDLNIYQKYGVSIGTYTFSNISADTPIAFTSLTASTEYGMKGTEYGKKTINGTEYMFYTGDVELQIYEDFSDNDTATLSIIEYNSESGLENKLVYKEDCGNVGEADFSYVICLHETSTVNTVIVDSSYFYAFNSSNNYFDYKRFGVHVGTYTITNIPLISPMAFINNDISNNVEYTGDSNKKYTATGPDGNTYDFYYGSITLKIFGDFGTMSAYSYRGHYAGTEDQFVFTDVCEVDGKVTQCMDLDTSFNKYDNKFTFNDASEYNEFIQYGVTTGTYTINNIPSTEALGFITNDISNNVEVYGASDDLCGNFVGPDGNTYEFYTNKIQLIIRDEFSGYLKLYSKTDSSYNNGESLIKYTSTCDSINSSQKFIKCLDSTKTLTLVETSNNDISYVVLDASLNFNEKRIWCIQGNLHI